MTEIFLLEAAISHNICVRVKAYVIVPYFFLSVA